MGTGRIQGEPVERWSCKTSQEIPRSSTSGTKRPKPRLVSKSRGFSQNCFRVQQKYHIQRGKFFMKKIQMKKFSSTQRISSFTMSLRCRKKRQKKPGLFIISNNCIF